MLGFVIRELSYLKLLQPLINKVENSGCTFVFIMDSPKGEKEYNRPTRDRLIKSLGFSPKKLITFSNDKDLISKLHQHKIKKMVSVEVGLWANSFISKFKDLGIKIYSLSYLTDSMWQGQRGIAGLDKIYYTSPYLKDIQLKFCNVREDFDRDMCLGSPLFDQLSQSPENNGTLILLPNIRVENVKDAFGSENRFLDILSFFGKNIIFKCRKKQWLPKEIERFAGDIIFDGDIMYPSITSSLFKKSNMTVMFYSSGVYEAVYSGQHVINIKIPLSRWSWDLNKMKEYFGGKVYNTNGVVESVSQDDVLSGKFTVPQFDKQKSEQWKSQIIKITDGNSCSRILNDIGV